MNFVMGCNRRLLLNKIRRHQTLTVIAIFVLLLLVCFTLTHIMKPAVIPDLSHSKVSLRAEEQEKSRGNMPAPCNCDRQTPPANSGIANNRTLIRFPPVQPNENIDDLTFDNVHLFPCTKPQGTGPDEVEDLMCIPRPNYLPGYKNPCYYDKYLTLRCMPYYNILGFDKCGTTDLSFRMQLHPSILKCHAYLYKEIYYWGWRRFGLFMKITIRLLNLDQYASIFHNASEAIAPLAGQPNQPIVGDGGPVDGWDFRGWQLDPQNKGLAEPKVLIPQNMRHILKEPRFIVLMRNPTERLYSDYLYLKYGKNPEKFALDASQAVDMLNACLKANTTRQCFYSLDLYQNLPARLHIGCYSVFLREWLSVFHRKHFFFLRSEDYEKDIRGSLRAIFSFLGIDSLPDILIDDIAEREKKLQTSQKKAAGSMFPETRKLLQDFYEPCNQDLARLLGDDKYLWQDT